MANGFSIPGGPSFFGFPKPADVPCDPTGKGWRGPPGPTGPQGVQGPIGPAGTLEDGELTGPINTTSPTGYSQYGTPLIRCVGNSNNVTFTGPTVTLVGLHAGEKLPATDFLTTAVGYGALANCINPTTESTAVGWGSQYALTTGGFNTTLGVNTLGHGTTADHNIAIGTDSMRNSNPSMNTGIGRSTLIDDNAGWNIAIGDDTFHSNQTNTGQFNIAIGTATFLGTSMTTARENVIIGTGIANGLTSGSDNVIIGHINATALTTGSDNTIVGAVSGNALTTGNGVTILGQNSGNHITSGSTTTIIGANVATTTYATGGNVLLIGTGQTNVDTPVAAAVDYINICNILTVTGIGTPATSHASFAGRLNLANIPTSSAGLLAGDVWRNGTVLNIV